jgi:hypothetical protein
MAMPAPLRASRDNIIVAMFGLDHLVIPAAVSTRLEYAKVIPGR